MRLQMMLFPGISESQAVLAGNTDAPHLSFIRPICARQFVVFCKKEPC